MAKKLIYVTTRLFWPADSGRKVVLYHYCRGLHEMYGYEIYLYSFLEPDQAIDAASTPEFISEAKAAKKIKPFETAINLLSSITKPDSPWQCALFQSRKNKKELKEYCSRVQPDAIIVDMIRLAPYIRAFDQCDCPKYLNIDDLLSKRYARQLESNYSLGFFGAYSAQSGKIGRMVEHFSWIKNRVLKSESKRVGRAELSYAQAFDKVFFVSELEAAEFNEISKIGNAYSVGMGVDVDYYAEPVSASVEKNTLSFVGDMAVAANADSLRMIKNCILPYIRHDVVLNVIGNCPAALRNEHLHEPRIKFLGRVDDVRPFVKSTELFLAPIAYGTGIKTKILEAMAMRMCVLTNSVGAESISARAGVDFVVEDGLKALAEFVDELLDDREHREAIALSAQNYVDSHCRWHKMLSSFEAMGFSRMTSDQIEPIDEKR